MCFFFWNSTHILTRTQGETFEDIFLVKIASKGTSFRFKTNVFLELENSVHYSLVGQKSVV